jgi:hypothetical protein
MSVRRCPFRAKRLAGVIILAASLMMPATQWDAPRPRITTIKHARVRILRNDDGTLKFGPRNQVETSNWSGYAVVNFATGVFYTGAQASWNVPTVGYVAPPPVCHLVYLFRSTQEICSSPNAPAEYSSSWVGIGGFCENANCTSADNTLIQIGTEQDVSKSGETQYYAWVETIPDNPIMISPTYPKCNSLSCAYSVKPGDAITASVSCTTSNCFPGQTQSWLLTMTNATENWTFSTTISYVSTLLSAEWIEEAPTSQAGILPLADFVSASFDATIPSGLNKPQPISMVDPYGETSAPSSGVEVASSYMFETCWGNNPSSIASCPATAP